MGIAGGLAGGEREDEGKEECGAVHLVIYTRVEGGGDGFEWEDAGGDGGGCGRGEGCDDF